MSEMLWGARVLLVLFLNVLNAFDAFCAKTSTTAAEASMDADAGTKAPVASERPLVASKASPWKVGICLR